MITYLAHTDSQWFIFEISEHTNHPTDQINNI